MTDPLPDPAAITKVAPYPRSAGTGGAVAVGTGTGSATVVGTGTAVAPSKTMVPVTGDACESEADIVVAAMGAMLALGAVW